MQLVEMCSLLCLSGRSSGLGCCARRSTHGTASATSSGSCGAAAGRGAVSSHRPCSAGSFCRWRHSLGPEHCKIQPGRRGSNHASMPAGAAGCCCLSSAKSRASLGLGLSLKLVCCCRTCRSALCGSCWWTRWALAALSSSAAWWAWRTPWTWTPYSPPIPGTHKQRNTTYPLLHMPFS
jgi:hypothetical protein